MVQSEEARAALGEVRGRTDQMTAALARARPPGWTTAVISAGCFIVLAGLDVDFPTPLITFAAGGSLLAAGIAVGVRHASATGARGRRGTWSARNIALTGGWIAAIYLTYALGRLLLAPVVDGGLTSVLAAVAPTTIFAGMAAWLYRNAFGRRAGAGPAAPDRRP